MRWGVERGRQGLQTSWQRRERDHLMLALIGPLSAFNPRPVRSSKPDLLASWHLFKRHEFGGNLPNGSVADSAPDWQSLKLPHDVYRRADQCDEI